MAEDVKTIAVIGAGQMGGGIAQVSATAGLSVVVFDENAEAVSRCREQHQKRIGRLVEKGKMPQADADAALARITYAESFKQVADADWVIEAIVEDAGVKKDLFQRLVKTFTDPRVVLATNTSSISITEIAAAAGDSAPRVVGMHFFNPVPVMKLVEVIQGLQTDEQVVQRTIDLAERMGKTPVKANDRPGFVSNRVLMPMINEAFYAWMEGVADPEAIDNVMTLGCAHPMGPLRLADFIGLDTCLHILEVLHRELGDPKYRPCPLLKQHVAAGRLGDKTGRGVYEYTKQ